MNALTTSRRSFFAGAAAATAVAGLSRVAHADLQCVDAYAARECEAGIPSVMIHTSARRSTQHQSQWCWAACISMLFGYHGHPVSQARLVREAYGRIVDLPAMPATMLAQLNRVWVDDHGIKFRASSSFGQTNAAAVATDLAADQPLVIGTKGHAVVLTSLRYRMTPTSLGLNTQLLAAKVRDPFPGRGLRHLDAQEWAAIAFAAHVRVQTLPPPTDYGW